MLFLKLSGLALCHVIFDIITVITVNNREVVPEPVNRFFHICFYVTGILFAMWFYNYVVQLTVRYKYVRRIKTAGYIIFVLSYCCFCFFPWNMRKVPEPITVMDRWLSSGMVCSSCTVVRALS
jgi:hypothetical protein